MPRQHSKGQITQQLKRGIKSFRPTFFHDTTMLNDQLTNGKQESISRKNNVRHTKNADP